MLQRTHALQLLSGGLSRPHRAATPHCLGKSAENEPCALCVRPVCLSLAECTEGEPRGPGVRSVLLCGDRGPPRALRVSQRPPSPPWSLSVHVSGGNSWRMQVVTKNLPRSGWQRGDRLHLADHGAASCEKPGGEIRARWGWANVGLPAKVLGCNPGKGPPSTGTSRQEGGGSVSRTLQRPLEGADM